MIARRTPLAAATAVVLAAASMAASGARQAPDRRRVLGRYVRERGVLTLMDALPKMTLMPAERLEAIAPAMKTKGRLQAGAAADITIFDLSRLEV